MELILGTANFDSAYGLQKTRDTVGNGLAPDLLRVAAESGFVAVDTSPKYGDAEAQISQENWRRPVHTKLVSRERISTQIADSLARLQRDRVDVYYLFHDPTSWGEGLHDLTTSEITLLRQHSAALGASVYTVEDFLTWGSQDGIEVVQFPLSIMNPAINEEVVSQLGRKPKLIARSVLIRGLIFDEAAARRDPEVYRFREALVNISQATGRALLELALGWIKSRSYLNYVVVGADSVEQLVEISETWSGISLGPDELSLIEAIPTPTPRNSDLRKIK